VGGTNNVVMEWKGVANSGYAPRVHIDERDMVFDYAQVEFVGFASLQQSGSFARRRNRRIFGKCTHSARAWAQLCAR